MTTTVLASRTLRELEEVVEKGQTAVVEMAEALAEIRDRKLYKPEYSRFQHYCRDRWGLSPTRIYQLLDFAAVRSILPNVTEPEARKIAPEMRANGDLPTRKTGQTRADRDRKNPKRCDNCGRTRTGPQAHDGKCYQCRDEPLENNGTPSGEPQANIGLWDDLKGGPLADDGIERVWVLITIAGKAAPVVQVFPASTKEDEERALAARDGEMTKGRVFMHKCEVQRG